jgi:hypothetical protein
VILRVSQADTINLLYKSYNDTINSLKQSIVKDRITFYDTLIKKVYVQADSSLYWKAQLEATKKVVVPPAQHDSDDKFIPLVLSVLALFLFLHK